MERKREQTNPNRMGSNRLGLLLSKPPKEGGLTLRKLSNRMRSVYIRRIVP